MSFLGDNVLSLGYTPECKPTPSRTVREGVSFCTKGVRMPGTMPDEGKPILLLAMLNAGLSARSNAVLRLGRTPVTITDSTVLADFTEANFTGYTAVSLDPTEWQPATVTSHQANSTYGMAPIEWTCGATGNTIYNAYVEDPDSGKCLWAQALSTPRVLTNGDKLDVTEIFGLKN